ncbi:hypothetical protein AVME950_02450 [Acidovorax sp. SUPP950]|uniref:hypothetical protein n=1 Tax=Acidovorax sp. SUPP950 TaxID=511901 RepID=UPI0023CDECCC|nr:hypothetical protein [Acidovorax sp. SUPP950]GKS73708.1 hypothetical protein AVME950_02450 [Acidovorax sp. SUPP950]
MQSNDLDIFKAILPEIEQAARDDAPQLRAVVDLLRARIGRDAASSAAAPSDAEILKVAETLGRHRPFDSWGMGYRKDEAGAYTVPVTPRLAVPFARAVLARWGASAQACQEDSAR